MKLGSLFDGIGGALLCAKRCGIEPVLEQREGVTT